MPLRCAAAAYVQDGNAVEASRHKTELIQFKFSNDFLLKQMEKRF